MTRLIVIRHGQSVANKEDKFAGHSDFDLTDLGRRQAELAAEYVKEHFTIDAAYASDLLRAYNTALPVAKAFGLEVTPTKAFREIYAGRWEGKPFPDVIAEDPEIFVNWRDNFEGAYCPEGETVREVRDRVVTEAKRIAELHDGKTVLIAAHATPVRAIHVEADPTVDAYVGNATINVFNYENGKFTVVKTNIDEHLGDLKTYLPGSLEK